MNRYLEKISETLLDTAPEWMKYEPKWAKGTILGKLPDRETEKTKRILAVSGLVIGGTLIGRGVGSLIGNTLKRAKMNKYLVKVSSWALAGMGAAAGAGAGVLSTEEPKVRNVLLGGAGGAVAGGVLGRMITHSSIPAATSAARKALKIKFKKTIVHEHLGQGKAKTSIYTTGENGTITPSYTEHTFKDLPPNVQEYFKKNPTSSKLTREELS